MEKKEGKIAIRSTTNESWCKMKENKKAGNKQAKQKMNDQSPRHGSYRNKARIKIISRSQGTLSIAIMPDQDRIAWLRLALFRSLCKGANCNRKTIPIGLRKCPLWVGYNKCVWFYNIMVIYESLRIVFSRFQSITTHRALCLTRKHTFYYNSARCTKKC